MNRKTIYYIKDEGTKKNVISLASAQAEKHFVMGVALEIDGMVWALPPDECVAYAEKEVKRYLNRERGIRLDDIVTPSVLDVASNYGKVMGGGFKVIEVGPGEVPKSIQRKDRQVYGVSPLLETILKMRDVEAIHKLIRDRLAE